MRRRRGLREARVAMVLGVVAVGAWCALAARAAGPATTDLSGTLQLLDHGGAHPAKGEAEEEAVVWFEPRQGGAAVTPVHAELGTYNKSFVPRVLVVPLGSTVRFPNRDPIVHNVFSVSRGNAFDLGLVGQGPGKDVRFETPGVVRVFCNVHHDMVAYIVVLETPYFARPDAQGRFVLRGLPSGPGTLHAWHERADSVDLPLVIEDGSAPVTVRLELSRPRIPPHLNKFGRRYGRSRDRYER